MIFVAVILMVVTAFVLSAKKREEYVSFGVERLQSERVKSYKKGEHLRLREARRIPASDMIVCGVLKQGSGKLWMHAIKRVQDEPNRLSDYVMKYGELANV